MPTAATTRQLQFLRSLVNERSTQDLGPELLDLYLQATCGSLSTRETSLLIDRVMAVPRMARIAPTSPQERFSDIETVPSPDPSNRAGRMLLAGGIEATATLASGQHVTVHIRTRRPPRSGERGWRNCSPTERGARTTIKILDAKVGWVNVSASGALYTWTLTFRTHNADYIKAIRAVFLYAAGDDGFFQFADRVQEATRCGRCMRQLTDPVSIDRGVGPECFGRDTGSQHVARDRAQPVDFAVTSGNTVSSYYNVAGVAQERSTGASQETVGDRHRLDGEFAAQERALRNTATDPVSVATPRAVRRGDLRRAEGMIAEALDSYFTEDDARFAMRIFRDMKRQVEEGSQ